MAEGTVLTQGSAAEIKQNPQVIDAYLGSNPRNRQHAVS
jgi:ABC-type branched-subunit amino acid transport system ATPase component